MKSILSEYVRDDLPNESLKLLSDVIGINQIKVIMLKLPGVTIHVPKTLYRQSDNNYLSKHMDLPVKELSLNMGCSERTTYRKIKELKAAAVE